MYFSYSLNSSRPSTAEFPGHKHSLEYLFFGLEGHGQLVPFMWTAAVLAFAGILLLLFPKNREKEGVLAIACVLIFVSTWIDKGLGLIVGGFVPSPVEKITEYAPTFPEILITIGVWATGFLILTVLIQDCLIGKEGSCMII